MALNIKGIFNVFVETVTDLTEKGSEKLKEASENASQLKSMNRNTNKSMQKNTSNETIYFKVGFQNLNNFYNILNEKKRDLEVWEKMDRVLNNVSYNKVESNSPNEVESNNSTEVEYLLTATEVYTFANNLCHTKTKIYLQEDDGSWTELKDLFKLTNEDVEMYNQQGYFSRKVKMDFVNTDEVESIVDANKARIVNDVIVSMSKICKLPSGKNKEKITSSLLAAMQNLLNTIRADFDNHLNLSTIYDIISDAYENYWVKLPSEEKENLDYKDKQVIKAFCTPEDVVIDVNSIPESIYTNKVIPRLGLYKVNISEGNNQDGKYFVEMSLPGAKVSKLRNDIEKARTTLKKEALSQIGTLLNLIP